MFCSVVIFKRRLAVSTPDICSSTWTVRVEIYFRVTGILIICCCFHRFFKERDIVSGRSPDRDQADPSYTLSKSVRLYDFVPDIQDAIKLRALGPCAELVKTMSVRDSQCIRIVTPDDHVECGFHGILFHEMREEELSFVATSELDGDWPRVLLALMTRYRQNLERKRKECKERFGCTQSGNCKHCGKYILTDFEKHISFCHLELAWLCCCLVMWCTMWRWTTRDCREYIRRMHQVPSSVRPANLAKFFPAWIITREQWADLLLPSTSGWAVDTLFFSRMASPPGYRYWLISRTGCQYDAVFSVDDFPVVFGAKDAGRPAACQSAGRSDRRGGS